MGTEFFQQHIVTTRDFFQRDFSMDKAFIRLKDEKVPSSEEYQCFSYLGTK